VGIVFGVLAIASGIFLTVSDLLRGLSLWLDVLPNASYMPLGMVGAWAGYRQRRNSSPPE
jgi:hypothetical protein